MGDCQGERNIVAHELGMPSMNEKEYEAFVNEKYTQLSSRYGNTICLLVVAHGLELIDSEFDPIFKDKIKIMSIAKYAHGYYPEIIVGDTVTSVYPKYIDVIFKWAQCFKLPFIFEFSSVIRKLQETIRGLADKYGVYFPEGTSSKDSLLYGYANNNAFFDFNFAHPDEIQDKFGIYVLCGYKAHKDIFVSNAKGDIPIDNYNILGNEQMQEYLVERGASAHDLTNLNATKKISLLSLVMLFFSLGYRNFNIITITCREIASSDSPSRSDTRQTRASRSRGIRKKFQGLGKRGLAQSRSNTFSADPNGEKTLEDILGFIEYVNKLKKALIEEPDENRRKIIEKTIKKYEYFILNSRFKKLYLSGSKLPPKMESRFAVEDHVKKYKLRFKPTKFGGTVVKRKKKKHKRKTRKHKRKTKLNIF
jgi:hypothetical protein